MVRKLVAVQLSTFSLYKKHQVWYNPCHSSSCAQITLSPLTPPQPLSQAMTMAATDTQFLGGSNSNTRASRLECSTISRRCSIPSRESLRDSQRTEPNLLTGAYSPMANRFIAVGPNSCNSSSKGVAVAAAAAAAEAVASPGSCTVKDQEQQNRGRFLSLATAVATKPVDPCTTTTAVRIAEGTVDDNNENREVCARVLVNKNLELPVCSPAQQSHQRVQPTTSGHIPIEAPSCAVQTPVERELQQQQRKATEAHSVLEKPSATCLLQSNNMNDDDATVMATSGYPAADNDIDATSHDEHLRLHSMKSMAGNSLSDNMVSLPTRAAAPPVQRHPNYEYGYVRDNGSDQQHDEVQHKHEQQREQRNSDSFSSAQTPTTPDAAAKTHVRKNVTFCLVLEVYLIPQAKEYSKRCAACSVLAG